MPKIRLLRQSYLWRSSLLIIGLTLFGCASERPKTVGIEGHRDLEAVAIRIHNKTKVEFIVQAFVRERQRSFPIVKTFVLPSTEQSGEFEQQPDLELPLFSELPISSSRVGGYSLEFVSEKLETRLAVIDFTQQEMDDAKAKSTLVITLTKQGLNVLVGSKAWFQPWLRDLPTKKKKVENFAPDSIKNSSGFDDSSSFTKSPSNFIGSE